MLSASVDYAFHVILRNEVTKNLNMITDFPKDSSLRSE